VLIADFFTSRSRRVTLCQSLTTSPTLLEALRKPNQPEAWEQFVRLYTPLLLVWARRQGFQDADASDLVQEVFVKLVHLLPTYERSAGQSFRGWLSRVCKNQCADYRRRRATRALPGADGLSTLGDRPAMDLEEDEYRRQLVRRGLELIRSDFNDTTWAGFAGLVVEGRSVAEVAAALGISTNAVHMARYRVLKRLREELAGLLE
jgi:RNA polymerase sigma-70 factor (ECF subfamily)